MSKVVDGDTVYVQTNVQKPLKIRLAYVDAPELSQPFGKDAKAFLKKFEGKDITVKANGKDRYGRVIAVLFHEDDDINLSILKNGFGWAYTKYLRSASATMKTNYRKAEKFARINRLGLWKKGDYIAPWDWRETNRKKHKTN